MGEYMGISAQKYWQDGTQVENLGVKQWNAKTGNHLASILIIGMYHVVITNQTAETAMLVD